MDTSSRPAPPVPPAEGTAWVQPPHLPRRGSPGTTGHGNQQLAPLPPCVPHPGHPAPRAALTAPQNCALRRNATAPELLALPPEPAGALQLGKGSLQHKSISISPFFFLTGDMSGKGVPLLKPPERSGSWGRRRAQAGHDGNGAVGAGSRGTAPAPWAGSVPIRQDLSLQQGPGRFLLIWSRGSPRKMGTRSRPPTGALQGSVRYGVCYGVCHGQGSALRPPCHHRIFWSHGLDKNASCKRCAWS